MDRWVSRSSSGRLTSARSRCSWSAISTCSIANRGSSFPNRIDVDRVERDLVQRRPALLAGTVGTFDDLFRLLAGVDPFGEGIASEIQRTLAVRRAVARVELGNLGASAATAGFADTLLQTIGELESALVDLDSLDRELFELVVAYRDELASLGLQDRDGVRRLAVERLRGDLDAWSGAPVFAYGFEDLTGAEWALIEALSARTDVTVSIPYEPGRAAFEALERTVEDLAGLAGGRIEELPPATSRPVPAALGHLERHLFSDELTPGPALDGAIRFLEGAGTRGTVELLASEVAAVLRGGLAPERVAIVCDSPERWRTPLGAALSQLQVPFAVEQSRRLADTAIGRALLSLLRYAWLGGGRGDLFGFLRSPFSGLERRSVDFVEGRLRGRAIAKPDRVDEETERLRGAHVPALAAVRAADSPLAGVRELVELMVRNAWGLESPPVVDEARVDARAYRVAVRSSRRAAGARGAWHLVCRGRHRGCARAVVGRTREPVDRSRRGARPRACADAGLRRRLRARARGGRVPAACPPLAAPRRRRPSRARGTPRTAGRRRT